MRTTIGKLLRPVIAAFIYGVEGVGKTRIPMSLADSNGRGVAFITPESTGPTSLVTAGYSPDLPVELISRTGLPFDPVVNAIRSFALDKTIRCIAVDGLTLICGIAVDELSGGEGEKALGFDGWQQVLAGFRKIEAALTKVKDSGKSFVMTAWEAEPVYEQAAFGNGQVLTEQGRPWLQGKAKKWMPGNCDIIARMTSSFKPGPVDPKTKKASKVWEGRLQVHPTEKWLAKTRWDLPEPCPPDLAAILRLVNGQVKKAQSA